MSTTPLPYRTQNQFEVKGATVLVRVDFNVPVSTSGRILSDARIKSHLPTLRDLISRGAKVVLLAHLGRPAGPTPALSLKRVAQRLAELLRQPVQFSPDLVGPNVQAKKKALQPGEVLVIENTRFCSGEEANDATFAKQLALGCDVYLNDAFASCHRAHASTYGVIDYIPQAGIGLLMAKEMVALEKIMRRPAKPMAVVIGGAKISSKFSILKKFVQVADHLMVGGAMANTFLLAQGYEVGQSLVEPEMLPLAAEIMALAVQHNCQLLLPVDVVVAGQLKADVPSTLVAVTNIAPQQMVLDLGPQTLKAWRTPLQNAKTILWNGPLGAFETVPFNHGTNALVNLLAEVDGFVLAGGGDTINAIATLRREADFDYISTGGGALLEFLEGQELPALQRLRLAKA